LDSDSGQLKQVLGSDRIVDGASNGVAWVLDVDPAAEPLVNPASGERTPNRLSRLDLRTGRLTSWFTAAGGRLAVIG
jgi:hypothetical protein